LVEKFPSVAARKLSRSNPGQAQQGSMSLTRFYPRFVTAISGDLKALNSMREELRLLNGKLVAACEENKTRGEGGGVFFGGSRFSREDTGLAPMLNLVEIAGNAILGVGNGIPSECVALRRYLEEARKMPSFAKSVAPAGVIVGGFRRLQDKKHKDNAREIGVEYDGAGWLSDALE
jgi:hypothetical protein